jgi:hypothetical protein
MRGKPSVLLSVLVFLVPSLALAAAPDLTCSITASEHKDGSNPIQNGSNVEYNGSSWIHFRVTNKGNVKATNFLVKMVVEWGGTKVYDPPAEKVTLGPGAAKDYPPVPVKPSVGGTPVEARMLVNVGYLVKESDEKNNSCTFKFRAKLVS